MDKWIQHWKNTGPQRGWHICRLDGLHITFLGEGMEDRALDLVIAHNEAVEGAFEEAKAEHEG